MTNRTLGPLALAFAALLLPLAGDGTTNDSNNCFRASTSLAAGTLQPVAGDETFFNSAGSTGAGGPSSIMFLLDNSGSMTDFPQCSGGVGSGACGWSNPTTPSNPSSSSYLPTVNGTCDYTANATLKWMNAVVPTSAFADPGYSVTGYVVDSPPWSPAATGACTGNSSCLFDPAGIYVYNAWTETGATKELGDGCTLYDGFGNVQKDAYGNTITAGSACTTCLASSGFYIARVRYVATKNAGGPTSYATWNTGMHFSGKWLNANPPKFVSARRAIKTLLKIDPATPLARDTIRYGLATFWGRDWTDGFLDTNNGGSTAGIQVGDGARLVVPLGPDCAGVYTHVQARQKIVDAINAVSPPIRFETYTPLAEALFNIAQYFSAAGGTGFHQKSFGAVWSKVGSATNPYPSPLTYDPGADFRESSPGAALAPWAIAGGSASSCSIGSGGTGCPVNPDQSSVCWACQVSAAIVVTDGMPNNESGLPKAGVNTNHAAQPPWDFQRWRPSEYLTHCKGNPFTAADQCQSYLPLVALYMAGNDLRDAGSMTGIQNVMVHTISFGIDGSSQAAKVLQTTADLGNGKFANTQNTAELEAALVRAANNVQQRATSFSAANANALQTNRNSATETFFARFSPNATRAWKGHLIQAILFDEFAMGCDPTLGPTDQPKVACGTTTVYPNFDGNVDAAGHNICDGVFLVDNDCREITEDGKGNFVLADDVTQPANLPWDAGVALSTVGNPGYKSGVESVGAGFRKIKTCVAPAGGTASSPCVMTDFITANVDLLSPAMSLDQTFCAQLISDAAACGGTCPVPGAGWTAANTRTCANLIIYYVRGFDTMDQDGDGCRSPINSSTCASGEQRDVGSTGKKLDFWKLGDIFHSTPAVVKPPVDELRCDLGYDPQCVATIHSPTDLPNQTPIVRTYAGLTAGSKVDAYESWRITNKDRKRVVLAGANDGMLHAFDGGDAIGSATPEPLTGVLPYSQGNAAELWAFIPPDLLPRLKFLLYGHQYMVDGSTMVRDVWVDGGSTGTGTKDGTKQNDEFHTVAVISERSGGTQFTALDVSDPQNPAYLWTFPPPGSDDARYMGESWADFAPRPPPIGPVKLSTGVSTWEERWVVMLNGGYDPALVKGRAVFMVDAWTGKTVWRFTNDDFKAMQSGGTPASMFPVPASVGLVDLGDVTKPQLDSDGFFDTATWGDLGGNVWLARFFQPGVGFDAAAGSRVNNWFAARAFEQQRRTDNQQYLRADGAFTSPLGQSRSEFYFMTANTYEGTTRTMRTYIGGGNREHMLDQASTPTCGPDNLMDCCRNGCTNVTTSTVDDFGACTRTQTFSCVSGLLTLNASTTTCGAGPTCAAAPKNNYTSTTNYSFTCGGFTKTETAGLTCDINGVCSAYSELSSVAGRDVGSSLLTDSANHNRFYGFWSYGRSAGKMFDDPNTATALTQAKAFDAQRFTDVTYSGSCAGTSGNTCTLLDVTHAQVTYDADNPASALTTACTNSAPRCEATVDDAGWFYEYGRECPVKTCDPLPPWSDEKTSAGGNIVLGCTAWSGFRPFAIGSTTTSTDPCLGGAGTYGTYGYVAHFVTGVPTRSCGYTDNGTVYRSAQRNTWSPPSAATARVSVNAKGQVSYSTLNLDPGAPPSMKTLGTRTDVVEPVYWMEVPRPLHQCRHVDGSSCE